MLKRWSERQYFGFSIRLAASVMARVPLINLPRRRQAAACSAPFHATSFLQRAREFYPIPHHSQGIVS